MEPNRTRQVIQDLARAFNKLASELTADLSYAAREIDSLRREVQRLRASPGKTNKTNGLGPIRGVSLEVFDPRIHFAKAPIVGGDGIRPVAVSPVQLCQIGSSDRAILREIKSIPAAHICCRCLADLHRSLGP